ncbi:MAG: HTH domain-containing protein [Clostridia bacterium]|nr:HTH domain-containing protein [Clostridia bacterium]
MEIREMILQAMRAAGKPLSAAEIAKLTGLDKKVVTQALALLKKDGDIVSPVRCKWEPNEKSSQ